MSDESSAGTRHANDCINRDLKTPPIAGPKVGEHPEIESLVYRTTHAAVCRVCTGIAEYVISVPGDVVPLCPEHAGRGDALETAKLLYCDHCVGDVMHRREDMDWICGGCGGAYGRD